MHATLSVRGLGELLVERYSSGNKPSDEDLTELQDQLTTIDSNLARTSEHISTGIATLDKMMTPSPSKHLANCATTLGYI